MNGYGSSTYLWENVAGKEVWVKYHFKTEQGIQNFTDAEARAMFAEDLNYHVLSQWEEIQRGRSRATRKRHRAHRPRLPVQALAASRPGPFRIRQTAKVELHKRGYLHFDATYAHHTNGMIRLRLLA